MLTKALVTIKPQQSNLIFGNKVLTPQGKTRFYVSTTDEEKKFCNIDVPPFLPIFDGFCAFERVLGRCNVSAHARKDPK